MTAYRKTLKEFPHLAPPRSQHTLANGLISIVSMHPN